MPLISVHYDDAVLTAAEARSLCEASVRIVKEVTAIENTFAYGYSARITVDAPPVEVYVEISASRVDDADATADEIRRRLRAWKEERGFSHPINLGLVPMEWKLRLEV